ncbi:Hydroxyacylglutathione hydrolase [Planctomycetes bacterium Pan216]|uniref:Hydroxyacylglutathione hydrolase n=1 Tax=Kolteria novifilia TaxID=2527975 RepID=A0A518B7X2_9BACT|nr:Hydroxyacylglutathione hydrolase [Planctomycetes bacterium Pan216]
MKLEQVSPNCFAVINESNRLCDSNSGLINAGGVVVVDTQSDLGHARRMIELFSDIWRGEPEKVVNTHEDCDHVWGNQLFEGAEIIGHRSLPERMKEVADPALLVRLQRAVKGGLSRWLLKRLRPSLLALGDQLREDYDFEGVHVVPPTTLFDERLDLNLDGLEVHLYHVGPAHQRGDVIVHVPSENVVFAGDVLFRGCTPAGWFGTHANWLRALDLLIDLRPDVIVPGHGPLCGLEGPRELKDYLVYVQEEARPHFEAGRSTLEAAKRIDFGPSAGWKCPARLYFNVERAYREFRGDPPEKPWDVAGVFDSVYRLAKAKGIAVEF